MMERAVERPAQHGARTIPSDRWAAAAVFVLTALAYAGSLRNHLLSWDDDRIIAGDPFLTRVSWAGLVDFFTTVRNEAYQPLHRLSYWLDVPWCGLEAGALHATNVLLWSLGASVCYLLLRQGALTQIAAGLATLWFALHPAQVEAVSWLTGRKDCLALLLGASSLLLFLRSRRVLSVLLYVGAVLSKTSCLPLPLVLLMLEVGRGKPVRKALLAQLPVLLVMLVLGALVVSVWSTHEMVRPLTMNPLLLVLATLGDYFRLAFYPAPLSALHPIWTSAEDIGAGPWLGLVAFVGSLLLAWKVGSRRWLFALLAFALMLLPVLNIVPLYFQRNDRYLSLPLLALAFGLGHTVHALALRMRRVIPCTGLAAWTAALLALNVPYQSAWANDVTLWTWATSREPRAFYAWLKLGHAERDRGEYERAMEAYDAAISARPLLVLGHAALFDLVVRHEVSDPAEGERLSAKFQRCFSRPEEFNALARELIDRDARHSTVLVLKQLLSRPDLSEESKRASIARARASSHPWVAQAMTIALSADHPARDPL
jgi:hypothetical protein